MSDPVRSEALPERISDAERAVMEILWAEAPLTATDIAERVPESRGWSLPTVKTLLSRLTQKRAIAYAQDGRRYCYRPLLEREDHAVSESKRLVDALFGGRVSPLVAHLAEHEALDDKDLAELEALIRKLRA